MEPAVQKRRSSGNVLTLVTSRMEPEPPPLRRRRVGFYLKLFLGLGLAVAALVATGYVVYQQAQEKAARKAFEKARRMASLDTPAAYRSALAILNELASSRPRDRRIATTRAEILALQWGRFLGGEEARRKALLAIQAARRLASKDGARMAVLQGYRDLYEGRFAEAARNAESALILHRREPHLGYVLGMARYHLGDLTAAEATLQLTVTQASGFLPARVALGRVQRQRGRYESAYQSLKGVLQESSSHVEARVELLLLRQARGEALSVSVLHQLSRETAPFALIQARVLLARARLALGEGEHDRARRLIEQSVRKMPQDPEIKLLHLETQLRPGGDVHKAWGLRSWVQERCRELVSTKVLLAEAALGVGQAEQAQRFLRRASSYAPPSEVLDRMTAVGVQVARETDEPQVADGLCSRIAGGGAVSPRTVEVCLVHAARTRDRRALKAWVARLDGRLRDLARALRDYQRYRYDRVVGRMIGLARSGETTPGSLLLLAESLQRVHRPAAALPFLKMAVRRSARSARARLALADGLQKADKAGEAVPHFKELIEEKPLGARILLDLGRLGIALGRYKDVEGIVERVSRRHRHSGHGPYLEGMLLLQGHRKSRRQARERFEAALMREPGHVLARLALARLAFWRGDLEGGRVYYQRAFRLAGRLPEITLALARSYFKYNRIKHARGRYVKAAVQYRVQGADYKASEVLSELGEKLGSNRRYNQKAVKRILRWALRISGEPPLSHLRMGRFLEARGLLDEALAAYRRAVRKGPEIAAGYYHLGSLLLATSREPKRAEQALSRFLDLTRRPDGRRARNAAAWLDRLITRRRYLARRKQ